MTFFFFGTLMDREVLAAVLGRVVPETDLLPARLHGFCRVRAAREPYPTLIRDRRGVVDGLWLRRVGRRDEARIRHFEDDAYSPRWLTIQTAGHGAVRARVFFAHPGLGTTDEPWTLEGWQRTHKEQFLEEFRAWMAVCPD